MRIAEYKQIGTEIVEEVLSINDYDENGVIIGQHGATISREIPSMCVVYRDDTAEEEAQAEQAEAERQEAL